MQQVADTDRLVSVEVALAPAIARTPSIDDPEHIGQAGGQGFIGISGAPCTEGLEHIGAKVATGEVAAHVLGNVVAHAGVPDREHFPFGVGGNEGGAPEVCGGVVSDDTVVDGDRRLPIRADGGTIQCPVARNGRIRDGVCTPIEVDRTAPIICNV